MEPTGRRTRLARADGLVDLAGSLGVPDFRERVLPQVAETKSLNALTVAAPVAFAVGRDGRFEEMREAAVVGPAEIRLGQRLVLTVREEHLEARPREG